MGLSALHNFQIFRAYEYYQPELYAGISAGVVTLVSIAVTPAAATINDETTQQFTATGTYSDSSTANITGTVTWDSSDDAVATISAGGLATGVSPGSVTISATLGAVSGDTTLAIAAVPLFADDLTDFAIDASGTFTRSSTAYHKNADNYYTSIASEAPRFAGATWNGSAWSGTATGLLREPAATNAFWPSNDLTGANWPNSVGTDSFDQPGLTGAANTATLLTDNNNSVIAFWEQRRALTLYAICSTVVYFTKRSDVTTFPAFRLAFTSGAGAGASDPRTTWMINPNTGAKTEIINASGIANVACDVIDDGLRWKVVISASNGGTGKATCAVSIYAALGTWGVINAASQGAITVENVGVYDGIGHALAKLMSPIVTATAAVARAVEGLSYTGVSADNETRIDMVPNPDVDLTDWNGTMPTPTVPVVEASVKVYAPGERP